MLWITSFGFIVLFASQYVSNLPYNVYPASDFWLNSPWLIMMKMGAVMVLAGGAFLWTEYIVQEKWSWIKQIGTTSLLVYWVHIELVYGRWFGQWKEQLNNYQCAAFAVVLIGMMLGLSVVRSRWADLPLPRWVPIPASTPRRVPGD
jgi:fucose 4-O-acetylase-like acetyltransferase